MNWDDASLASDILSKYGLTKLETKVYLSMIRLDGATVPQLTQILGTNRVELYRVLKNLTSKGLSDVLVGRPMVFRPVAPFMAVKNLIAAYEDEVEAMRRKAGELIILLESFRPSKPSAFGLTQEADRFYIEGGRHTIQLWKQMISNASHEILRVWTGEGLLLHDREGFLKMLSDCRDRNVRVRGITEISKMTLLESEEWSTVIELRHREMGNSALRYMIVDGKEAIITTSISARPSELTAVHTNHKTLVDGLRMEFENMWRDAIPAETMVRTLNQPRSKNRT